MTILIRKNHQHQALCGNYRTQVATVNYYGTSEFDLIQGGRKLVGTLEKTRYR